MNIDTPIQSQTSSLLRTFYILLNFLQHPPPNAYTPPESHISHTSIADELGRFKVWAGNIGALQKGPSSLDWRLREASHVTGPILRLLRDLEGGLKEATAILSGQRLPRDLLSSSDEDSDDSTPSVYSEGSSAFGSDNASTSQSQSMSRSSSQSSFAPRRPRRSSSLNSNAPLSELHQLQLGIQQTITHLFRLSILIRRATPRDRYKKKADLLPAYSSTFDIAHVREKFPRACEQSGLVERLGKANTKRRMYLKYREQHAMKLRRELRKVEEAEEAARQQALRPQDDDDDEEEEVEEVEEAPTLRVPQSVQARSVGQGTEATSAVMTTASTFLAEEYKADEEVEDEGSVGAESQTSFATSTAEDGAGGLKVPACPGDHGGEFECPYCWSIQVCRGRVAWKKHVFADLEPYICTHPNCHTPPFPTRSSWSTHELTTHRLEYHCTLHDRTFATSSALESHLLKHHTPTPTKLQLPLLVEKCQRPMTKFSPDDCPLCTTWGTRIRALEEKTRFVKEGEKLVVTARVFMRHLGRHMEQLALFALPRVTEGEEGSWDSDKPEFEGGSEGGSAVSDDGSEEDDKEQEVVETRKRRYESILPVVLEPYEGLEEEERQKLMENRYYLYAIEPLKTAAMVLDAALDPTIDINAKDEESKTLLMRAITDPGSDYQFAMTMVALLLRRGADVKSHDKYGWNARQASKEYWGEVLNQLLDDHEAGKDVLYGRPEDELIDAVRKRLELYKQSEEVLRLSILSGDFSSRLIEAVEGKNEWLVRRLLMCGGDPEYKTEDGQSPVQLARMVEGLMDGESKTPFGGKSMFGGITQILFKAISGKTGRPIEELEKEYSSGTWAFGETEDGPKPAELRQLRPDSDDEASERGEEEGQPETDAGALTDAGEQLPQDLAPVEHGNEVSVQSDKLGAFAGNRYYSSRCNVPGCDKAVGPSERRYKCRICVDVDHCADCYEKGHVVCRATGREHSLIPILRTGPALFGTAATDLIFPVKLLQIGRWTCSADEHKLVVRFSSTTNCITYHFIMSRNIYMMEMPLSSITWLIGPFEKGSFDNSVSPHPALYIGSVRTGELVPVQDPAATRRKLGLPDGPSHSLVPEGGDSAALQAEIDRLQATRAWKIRAMPTKCDCCSSPFGNSIWYRCSMDTCPKNVFCTLCIRRAESKFGHAKDHQFICFMGLEEENVLKEREMQAARLVAEEEEAKRSRETVEAAVEIGTEIGKLREQGEAHDQVAEEKLPDTLESSAQQEMGDPYSADRLPLPNISQLISRNGISLGDLEQVKDVQTDTLDAPVDEDMSDSSSATSDDDLPEAKITSCSPLHNDAWVDKDGVWTAVAVPEDDPFFRHCKGCKAPLKSDSKRHKCVICPDSNLCGNCFSSGKTCSVSQPERHPRCFITILRTARARKPLAECKDCGAKDYYGMWYGLYQSNSASAPAPAHPVAQATPAPEQTLHSNSTSVATPSSGETLQGPTTEAADEQSPASNPSWNFETLFSNPRAINTMSTDSQNVRKDEKEEPSSCSTCNKTFSRGRDRRRHEDQIHGKKVAAVL
ncbi:hypothetical protein BJ508DRAFT_79042 [Ascobolus immersus RN42]|uniref:C2H2-type domain-containing protein n=1 Tax=Ascobolus immersus RN42 TaxID=1160509 RepID=A0A3N4HF03_ASCIM|nr:hypothetical protein BJ508DRAFT_79042 [Ascobolus immersus RN42]